MKRAVYLALAGGLALLTALVVHAGVREVATAVAAAGFGIVLIALFRVGLLGFDVLSWWVLLPKGGRGIVRLAWYRYVADSVNTLLPVARIGGEIVRAHLVTRLGVGRAVASASVLVDVTIGVAAQLLFTAAGVGLFFLVSGGATEWRLVLGLGIFAVAVLGFYRLQTSGAIGRLARIIERHAGGRAWLALSGGADALDAALSRIYADRAAVFWCGLWRIFGWIGGTAEVWLILHLIGHPLTLAEAFVIESLGQAARSAGFIVPGGVGVQEVGIVLVGGQFGLAAEVALALSLVKRGRELIVGVPCLVAWQIVEGRGALRRAGSDGGDDGDRGRDGGDK